MGGAPSPGLSLLSLCCGHSLVGLPPPSRIAAAPRGCRSPSSRRPWASWSAAAPSTTWPSGRGRSTCRRRALDRPRIARIAL
eukprot:6743365-Prymnesium_polylepis.1